MKKRDSLLDMGGFYIEKKQKETNALLHGANHGQRDTLWHIT